MTDPAGERELTERALEAANRLHGELERDVVDLAEHPEGRRAALAAAEAAGRVAKELQFKLTEDEA
jgi:hypothetical protein